MTAEREIRSNDYVPNHGVHLRQSVSCVCGAVCHSLSLALSLSAIYNPPLCTVLITTRILTWRCFYGAAPPVAANACWIRAITTTTNATYPTTWILFCEQKKPNRSAPFLPEPSCSSICTCKLIISLSVYPCVCLSQLSPWSLQTDNGIWGKRSLMHCVCVCVFQSLVFSPIELVRPESRASAESSVKM